jgi:hypothetical protein
MPAMGGLRFNEHLDEEDDPVVFEHACKLGLEGIVSKRKDSRNSSGRSPQWINGRFKRPRPLSQSQLQCGLNSDVTDGGGYYTPSMLMGMRCVEQLPRSTAAIGSAR